MKIKAKAKINLSLNILGVKDGYHMLDSITTQINLADEMWVEPSDKIWVSYTNGFIVDENKDNTVKAIKEFIKEFNVAPVKVKVKKIIPLKAGLGGSSADAVGVVKAMAKLYNIKDTQRILSVLQKIGSDCPMQFCGGYTQMQGRGEKIKRINSRKKLYFVLLCEDKGVDTKECFALADRINNGIVSDNNRLINFLMGKDSLEFLDNALKKPAEILNPAVKENLQILSKYFKLYNLSGSGSCCYGVCENYFKALKIYKILKKQYGGVIFTKN